MKENVRLFDIMYVIKSEYALLIDQFTSSEFSLDGNSVMQNNKSIFNSYP